MRQLPTKPNKRQKLIIDAVADYYGDGATRQEKMDSKIIALFLMGRKARLQPLSEEQKKDMQAIKNNISDRIYSDSFSK
ncbi:MAG: hypothetical protein A2312_04240 [Candidatus Staskawiczbacteria bacterium RIFOXYB2_FULL_32_9]|nr:MAG: hypothetical protein UR22_C0009G0053 [Parcubacteria group bacterium GW2011_GWC2_32_10]OGZ78564.1 MAG: hypothetical protein A2360_04360 [Candidatus Staskawiczbacteria bacterium RIFOXYB1_FULL_32_11]OGZ82629.1 MAG: hypothetical protein A2312_04240 [Candidatus Staskawiczbacteria bacterium RIFOXYB2_FULL_32_9]